MIALADHPKGVVLPVRAQPGAKKDRIVGEYNEALKIAVTAPPEDGRANDALVELVRETFKLKRGQVTLIAGATSRDKKLLLQDVSREVLNIALSEFCRAD